MYSNGEINYKLKGKHVKVSVVWAYKAPEGTSDTHYSTMRGTRANLVIRQGKEQNFLPVLTIEPVEGKSEAYFESLEQALKTVEKKYPGISLSETQHGWELIIPDQYKEGHEAHFARVTEKYIDYVKNKSMPSWEIPNMIAKYYTTTQALELAKQSND